MCLPPCGGSLPPRPFRSLLLLFSLSPLCLSVAPGACDCSPVVPGVPQRLAARQALAQEGSTCPAGNIQPRLTPLAPPTLCPALQPDRTALRATGACQGHHHVLKNGRQEPEAVWVCCKLRVTKLLPLGSRESGTEAIPISYRWVCSHCAVLAESPVLPHRLTVNSYVLYLHHISQFFL